jgi:G3E family GTPase
MKGIVHVAEQPETPAIIHGVQNVFHEPLWLEKWPSSDHRTRLVFIGTRVNEEWVRSLILLVNSEVAAEIVRLRAKDDARNSVCEN